MLPHQPNKMHICFFTHVKKMATCYISYICSMSYFEEHLIIKMSRDHSMVAGWEGIERELGLCSAVWDGF